jgi:hypothetical protein
MADTLAQRLAGAPMSVMERLRVSMLTAHALRKIHDAGAVHGALCPRNVELTGDGGVMLAAGSADQVYTAPEVLAGHALDARSDIYSFGAMVFEMFTGRQPGGIGSTGSAAVDRLVMPCLAADRGARPARMQKVILELKVLMMVARRAAAASATKRLEARLVARQGAQERAIAEIQHVASEAVAIWRDQVSAMREGLVHAGSGDGNPTWSDRVATLEHTLETMKRHSCEFEQSVAADLVDLEETLRKQTIAIDAARTQISQTDELVERMVKALEALQRAVLDHEPSGGSPIAVN